jgi:polar amino acid transport system substrate-binding protein
VIHPIFFVVVCLWCVGATTLNAQETLILSRGSDHPMGIVSERILTQAYQRMGIDIETREMPVARSLQMANAGQVDGELFRAAWIEKDFPNLIRIPVVLAHGLIVVFTKNVEFEVNGWNSLRPYSIGVQIGVKLVEAKTAGMQVVPMVTVEQLFRTLAFERKDIVVLPRAVGLMTLKTMKREGFDDNLPLQDIKLLKPPLERVEGYHYLHKKNEQLVPKMTAVLHQMDEEGLIQRIREQTEAELFDATR